MTHLWLPRWHRNNVMSLMLIALLLLSFFLYDGWRRDVAVDMCGADIVSEIFMDDQNVKAVLYQFDCGAMDSFSSQISVLPIDARISSVPGNVFSAKHGSRRGEWGGPYVEINKKYGGVLEVGYIEDADVYQMASSSAGITVQYKKIPVDGSGKLEQGILGSWNDAKSHTTAERNAVFLQSCLSSAATPSSTHRPWWIWRDGARHMEVP